MQNEIAALSGIFLLTPLREGRPFAPVAPSCPSAFLLTPLREGRHNVIAVFLDCLDRISTHAPAGGATDFERLW